MKIFNDQMKQILRSNQQLQQDLVSANKTCDTLRNDLKQFDVLRKIAIRQLEKKINLLRSQLRKASQQIFEAKTEEANLRNKNNKFAKENRVIKNELAELKSIITKYKTAPRMISQARICKNCGNQYIEDENFNWSCRVHSSTWNGTMWWCCGRINPSDSGCRYSKHELKPIDLQIASKLLGENEEDEQVYGVKMKHCVCVSCKQLGHTSKFCPRDPNLQSILK